ncbi:MAG: molecular chaperone [Gammaproteobacteria bacterium]|nr:molecular chaperone [Gammaproteobacteria bacterium]MBI5618035.1 molecular chaperone [Gammaproteobacteria bacterium]
MASEQMLIVEIVDDTGRYGLREFCELCAVTAESVRELVEAGVLLPAGRHPHEWQFNLHAIVRLRRARRLQRDFALNLDGLALSLDLLDELEATRERVRSLERQLAQLLGE